MTNRDMTADDVAEHSRIVRDLYAVGVENQSEDLLRQHRRQQDELRERELRKWERKWLKEHSARLDALAKRGTTGHLRNPKPLETAAPSA